MCKRIQCEQCQKVSYSGCGRHLDQVFRGVDVANRCHCHERYGAGTALAALRALQAASQLD